MKSNLEVQLGVAWLRNENCVPVTWRKLICFRYFPMLGQMKEGFEACDGKAECVFG